MEDKDLRILWNEMHTDSQKQSIDIKDIIRKKHCVRVSKVLRRQKMNIWIYVISLIVVLLFTAWDIALMGNPDISLCSAIVFLSFFAISSYNKYRLLTQTADIFSIKESTLILKKKLARTMAADFIFCLLFFYGIGIRIILLFAGDSEQLEGLKPILWLFIGLMFMIPWLIRYLNKQRYKDYLNSLEKNSSFLESNP